VDNGHVRFLAFSPDSKTLAARGVDGKTVQLRELPDGRPLVPAPGKFCPVPARDLAYSPDGKWIARSVNDKAEIALHDAATGRIAVTLPVKEKDAFAKLCFSPDSRLLLRLGPSEAQVWQTTNGKQVVAVPVAAWCGCLSPDGQLLALGVEEAIHLWDLREGRELARMGRHANGVQDLAFAPDGRTLAAACFEGIRFWDVARRREVGFLRGFQNTAFALAYSPDGKLLAAGGMNSPLKIWEVANSKLLAELEVLVDERPHPTTLSTPQYAHVASVAFSPDGRMVAAGSRGLVRVWDLGKVLGSSTSHSGANTPSARLVLPKPPADTQAAAFSADGRRLAVGGADCTIKVYDAQTGEELLALKTARGFGVQDLAFAPDGSSLAAIAGGGTYRWAIPSGKELNVFSPGSARLRGMVRFTPDGKKLVARAGDLYVWDLSNGHEVGKFKVVSGWGWGGNSEIAPDGKSVTVVTTQGEVQQVDLAEGKELRLLEISSSPWGAFAVSPDGRLAAVNGVSLWDLSANKEVELATDLPRPQCAAFSRDSRLLAVGSKDGTIHLWDVVARKKLANFKAHLGSVLSLAFAPDGQSLLSGTKGQGPIVWDLSKLPREALVQKPKAKPLETEKEEGRPADEKQAALAAKAKTILQKYCYRCHGQDGAAEGGFNYVLDRRRLVERRRVAPGDAAKSRLLRRVLEGEMPPEDEKPRPDPDEAATLKQWVEAGAPDWNASGAPRRFISPQEVIRLVFKDRDGLDAEQRHNTYYFHVVHLYNAGYSEEELQTVRLALSKLLNSLSWGKKIVPPKPIDPAQTILRIDGRDYGWDRSPLRARTFDHDEFGDPYARTFPNGPDRPVEALPTRADWFVYAFSRPPKYHQLAQIPQTVRELEEKLKVNVAQDLREHKVVRAGFNGSGVSRNNRLIERHEGQYGYYWKSYDFASNVERKNLFTFPRGPAPGPGTFQHDGGEIIFRLPNGLQGYMLTDACGNRIDKGPIAIVSDPKRPDRAVENGISCMSCHVRGLIDKADQIRAHVEKNADSFADDERKELLALYPPREQFTTALRADVKSYEEALVQTGVKPGRSDPVTLTALRFEAGLDFKQVAAELWMTPAELRDHLERHPSVARSLGVLQTEGGTVQREFFLKGVADLSFSWEEQAPPARAVKVQPGSDYEAGLFDRLKYDRERPSDCAPPAIDPNFTWIATLESPRTVKLFRLATGKAEVTLKEHPDAVTLLVFARDGKQLASACRDGKIRIWDVRTGVLKSESQGPKPEWPPVTMAFAPDGKTLAADGPRAGLLSLWDVESGRRLELLPGHPGVAIDFSRDGTTLLNSVVVWDVDSWKKRGELHVPNAAIISAALSPDGKKALMTTLLGTVRLWDVATADEIAADRLQTSKVGQECFALGVAFSPDGQRFATIHKDGCLALWETEGLRNLLVIQAHAPKIVRKVTFAPDGKRLATTAMDGTVRFWDVEKMLRAAGEQSR
jgi:WD40 repeat protein